MVRGGLPEVLWTRKPRLSLKGFDRALWMLAGWEGLFDNHTIQYMTGLQYPHHNVLVCSVRNKTFPNAGDGRFRYTP